MQLNFPNGSLDLRSPRVMGVLNVTPDSFSDGGLYTDVGAAVEHALNMQAQGADIIDVGGESTRPGASPVTADDEIRRVVPVIEAIRLQSDVPISIDTSKPDVMRAAAAAGASLLNDVRAFSQPGALDAAAELELPICIMHMQGEPRTMQENPVYTDVVAEVADYLRRRAERCTQAGIPAGSVILDPGFGFGKSLQHNLALLANLEDLVGLGYPVLIGVSRKSMIGKLLGDDTRDRLVGSVILALSAARKGARILRVHDVEATVDALRVEAAVSGAAVGATS